MAAHRVLAHRLRGDAYPWLRNRFYRLLITRDTALRHVRHVATSGRLAARGPRVLFYPDLPSDASALYQTLVGHGWRLTNNPRRRFDLAIRWRDATRWSSDETLRQLAADNLVVNLRCDDISKSAVARTHMDVFGYSAQVDPTMHVGLCVVKSERNAVHDGRIVRCPRPAEPGCVYERLIDNVTSEGEVSELRVVVVGDRLPFAWLQHRSVERRFRSEFTSRTRVVDVEEVLSADEITGVMAFCSAMGLDYGELDVLRDGRDGRIYIVDANTTPFAFTTLALWGGSATIDHLEAELHRLSREGNQHLTRSRTIPAHEP